MLFTVVFKKKKKIRKVVSRDVHLKHHPIIFHLQENSATLLSLKCSDFFHEAFYYHLARAQNMLDNDRYFV